MLPVGHIVQGRYQIQRVLGQGGMGSVYLAQDVRLPRSWALKEMSDHFTDPAERAEAEASFNAEAQILAGLNHPNLPRISDFFQEAGRHYLVMDYIAGETLEQRLGRGPLSVPETLALGTQIADTLAYLHSQPEPVIFRDLKPANVILAADGRPTLVDFGIARVFRAEGVKDTRPLGTPGYAAPEQYGRGQSDARTDLFALGATLHHALSGIDPGDKPFQFGPLSELRGDVPAALERIVLRAVSLKPEDRLQSAADLRQALAGVERELSMSGVLPTSSKTTDLSQAAPPPAAPAAAPAVVSKIAGFAPGRVDLGSLRWGSQARATVKLLGMEKGKLVSDSRWLKVVPARCPGGDCEVTVYVDTRRLPEEAPASGLLSWRGRGAVSPLQVDLKVTARPLPGWAWPLAVGLFLTSLFPLAGLVSGLLTLWVASSAPPRHRRGMQGLGWLGFLVGLCWSALLGGGWALTRAVDWHHLLRG